LLPRSWLPGQPCAALIRGCCARRVQGLARDADPGRHHRFYPLGGNGGRRQRADLERFKEEVRAGRTITAAVDAAVRRAWPAIRDSNTSTFITCVILG